MIYLASAYSDPAPRVRETRYLAALHYAAWRIQLGEIVYSPIVYSHQLCLLGGLGGDWETWRGFDTEMIALAEKVVVLALDKPPMQSIGVKAEIGIAMNLGTPIQTDASAWIKMAHDCRDDGVCVTCREHGMCREYAEELARCTGTPVEWIARQWRDDDLTADNADTDELTKKWRDRA